MMEKRPQNRHEYGERDPAGGLPDIPPGRLVSAALVVTGVVVSFWLIWRFQSLFLILTAALIVSIGITPLVDWLQSRFSLSRAAGVVAVYFILILIVVILIWLTAPLIVRQTGTVGAQLSDGYEAARLRLLQTPNLLVRRLALELPDQTALLPTVPAEPAETGPNLSDALTPVRMIVRAILGVLAVFAVALYWTIESPRIKGVFYLLFPLHRRAAVREFVAAVEYKVSRFVIGQSILCLIIGSATLVAYTIIGLPNSVILAVLAGVMEAVPLVGPFLGAIPAAILAFSLSPLHALWVLIATIIIQQLENNVFVPRIMHQAVGVSPLVTLLSFIAFSYLFGIAGALIAIPLAAIIQLILDRSLLRQETVSSETVGRDAIGLLRYQIKDLIGDVRQQIRYKDEVVTATSDELEDSIEAIALDLDSLLARYRQQELAE